MKVAFNIKLISIVGSIFIIIFTLICYINFLDENAIRNKSIQQKTNSKGTKKLLKKHFEEKDISVSERIVHLDLKGAPPKVSYYTQLFPLLKKLGATGLLIEYEDMFPYNGPMLQNISALNAYSLDDIKYINRLAKQHELKVIPFIQTLGHLDFLLKLNDYVEYREVWNFPSTICPSYNKTLKLLEEMIEQVVNAHPDSKMIHVGCDEVSHLGKRLNGEINFMHDLGSH